MLRQSTSRSDGAVRHAFRVALFFPLGNSLSPLLDFQVRGYGTTCFQSALPESRDLVQDCYKFVTALSQLMEEVEYHFGNAVEKQMVRHRFSESTVFPFVVCARQHCCHRNTCARASRWMGQLTSS